MIIKANNLMTANIFNMPDKTNLESDKNIFKKLSTGQISSLFIIETPQILNQTMKCRMRELDQNARYVQEGVALVQTAQEGLEKSKSKLLEMKGLVAMAAQDIYTDEDRQKIQEEINRLNKELDHIAYNTNYKGYNLLATNDSIIDEDAANTSEDLMTIEDAANTLPTVPLELEEKVSVAGEDAAYTFPAAPSEMEEKSVQITKPVPRTPERDAQVEELLKRIERTSVTAVDLGTDKVDVSSAELAAQSMGIVEQALRKVEDELKKYKIYELEFAGRFRVQDPEEPFPLRTSPTMIIDALELAKYNLLNTEAHILRDNFVQCPENVANLLNG